MLSIALLLALLIGVSLGLLGGGGSILTVPILRYVLGMEGHTAIATSLLVVGTTSLAALWAHARKGRVQWRTGFVFGGAGMLGAYVAGAVAHHVPAPLLLAGFSVMMFAAAVAMLRPEQTARGPEAEAAPSSRRLPIWAVLLEGLVVGAVTGLVGAGGGFLVVPALVLLARLPMATAVGTSLLVIALKSFAGFAGYVGHTSIDWVLGLSISGSAVVGSVGGAWFATQLSARTLRQGFAVFVVAMAFFSLTKELPPLVGLSVHPGLAAAVSLVGTLLVAGVMRLVSKRGPRSDAPASDAKPAPGPASAAAVPSKLERIWS